MTVVVLDTNVYISALVYGGVPLTAVNQALEPPFQLAVSTEIEAEMIETLEEKFKWLPSRVVAACGYLWVSALWCKPVAIEASRDPKDNHVLGCALAASASALVTGDKDLLALHPFQSVAIVTPAAFLASYNLAAPAGA